MNIRGLLLGMAAALAVVTMAHATDAVVADQPSPFADDNAKPCDIYGTGYIPVPGTATCVRLGGQIRYDQHLGAKGGSSGRTTLHFESISE